MPRTNEFSGKKKLLVLLGAGSSVAIGIPSVTEIDALMEAWSTAWRHDAFPNGFGRGLYNDVRFTLARFKETNALPNFDLSLNFERVLGEMTALAAWVSPSPFGNALSAAVCDQRLSDKFVMPPADGAYAQRHFVLEQLSDLIRRLAAHMRERCCAVDESSAAFQGYKQVLEGLSEEFDLGVYNLNYDNLAVRVLPALATGFVDGIFSASSVARRQKWGFVYHLHGSVHYSLSGSSRSAMNWQSDLHAAFEDCHFAPEDFAAEFRPILPATIIAGGAKLDQLLFDPAQSFYASMIHDVHTADAIMIGGYGFGDGHVNRALQNRLDPTGRDLVARPPVVVVTKTSPGSPPIAWRQDLLAHQMKHTLAAFTGSCTTSPSVDTALFEGDNATRVSVWHNGFVEIAPRLDELVQRLRAG